MSKFDLKEILVDYVDYLLPELTPYENALYMFLLVNSVTKKEETNIRIGKRTIASQFVKGVRGDRANFAHVSVVLKGLKGKGCIKVGDTNREGTLYTIFIPKEIPLIKRKFTKTKELIEEDYFSNDKKRKELFERDKWYCQYCGEKVTKENATLDHVIPQYKGGKHTKDNLKTCCLICNSIKSGKTYEEAAPLLLRNIKERKERDR